MDTRFGQVAGSSRVSSGSTGGNVSGANALAATPLRAIPEALAEQVQILEQLDKEFDILVDRLHVVIQPYPVPSDIDKAPESTVELVAIIKRANARLDRLLDRIRQTHIHCQL